MPETGQARVVDCHQPTAGNWGAVHRERCESAAREVSLEDQSVVAGAKNDAVKDGVHYANLARGAHPPRVLLDAPRVHPFRVLPLAESSEPPVVFREGAENGTRGACAPSSTLIFTFTQDQPIAGFAFEPAKHTKKHGLFRTGER